jgi:hypothetical protein
LSGKELTLEGHCGYESYEGCGGDYAFDLKLALDTEGRQELIRRDEYINYHMDSAFTADQNIAL